MGDTPRIRFIGFTDDWKQRKLGGIVEFNPKSEIPDVFEYVDLESVVGTEMIAHKTIEKVEAPSRAQRLAQTGDLFFQTVRPYQKNNYLYEKLDLNYVFSTGYAQMRPSIDGYFLLSSVQTDQFVKSVLDKCTGTSYPAINSGDLSEMTVYIPPKPDEASIIGDYFRNLDHLIALHRCKCDEAKELKKYMLQKMFPQNGKRIPDIRFAGFTDDWEQRKLGTLCSVITKGTTPKDKSGCGNVNFVKVENINYDNGEISGTSKISDDEHDGYLKRSKLEVDDILFSIAGTLGRVSVVKSSILPANTNQVLAIIRTKEGYIPYLTTVLKGRAVEDFIKKSPMTGAQLNLSLEQVNSLEIPLPNVNEQIKIGDYFVTLDTLITLHQRQCDELKELKKFMLQNMFL